MPPVPCPLCDLTCMEETMRKYKLAIFFRGWNSIAKNFGMKDQTSYFDVLRHRTTKRKKKKNEERGVETRVRGSENGGYREVGGEGEREKSISG